jgi:colanic acid/amylovoran biosynthesis glycosyltransferase
MELVVVLSSFPTSGSEPYFEDELRKLATQFDKIHLIRTNYRESYTKYHIPSNVLLYTYKSKHASVWFLPFLNKLTRPYFVNEIESIKHDLKLNFSVLKYKIITQYLFKASHFSVWLNQLVIAEKIQTKLIYTYWLTEFTLGSIFYKNRFNPLIKVISRTHGWDCFYDRNPENYLPFRKAIIKESENVFPVSNAGTLQLYRIFKSSNIQTRYLGSAQFKQPQINNQKVFHVLTIAFVSPIKQLDLMAKAISVLSGEVKWTHVGFNNSEYETQLKIFIDQIFKNKSNIEFSPINVMSQDEITDWISSNYVDLFCSTSKAEGLPVSMMQAQSAGIPIISTNVGGVSEIVIENETGFLVTAHANETEISQAILRFYHLSESEKQRFRSNSFKNFKTNFDAEKNFSDFALELKKLSNQQKAI